MRRCRCSDLGARPPAAQRVRRDAAGRERGHEADAPAASSKRKADGPGSGPLPRRRGHAHVGGEAPGPRALRWRGRRRLPSSGGGPLGSRRLPAGDPGAHGAAGAEVPPRLGGGAREHGPRPVRDPPALRTAAHRPGPNAARPRAPTSDRRLTLAIESARRLKLTSWSELIATLAKHARCGRPGIRRLRRAIAAGVHRDEITDSDFELLVLVAAGRARAAGTGHPPPHP